jgi:hypothetical protein
MKGVMTSPLLKGVLTSPLLKGVLVILVIDITNILKGHTWNHSKGMLENTPKVQNSD